MIEDELSPVQVFEGTELEASMVKNILENENIEARIWNEILGSRQAVPIHVYVSVVVHRKNYLRAKEFVEGYLKNTQKTD
jgi:hypothetical protein